MHDSLKLVRGLSEVELKIALALQAFLPVPQWRMWDTGRIGYTKDLETADGRDLSLTLYWDRDNPGMWAWRVQCEAEVSTEGGPHHLAYAAILEGTRTLGALYPNYKIT